MKYHWVRRPLASLAVRCVLTSPQSDGVTWTPLEADTDTIGMMDTCSAMGFDPVHHLLYASCHTQGIWRVRTQ